MVYVVEILPYTLRAKGIALFWFVTGVAGAFNTVDIPATLFRSMQTDLYPVCQSTWHRSVRLEILRKSAEFLGEAGIDCLEQFFYVAWIAVEFAVVYLFFIETKGPSLEEVALLIDGKDAKVGTVNPVAEVMKESKMETQGFGVSHVERLD